MALPKAVQQQAEEADRLIAQMDGVATGEPNAEPPPNEPQDPPQDQVIDEPQADSNLDIPTEPQPANTIPEETWEQKYHVLQGKFDAEVPRLYADLREMQTQLKQVIAEKAVAEAKAVEQVVEPAKTLDFERDKEEFGNDLFSMVERVAESKVSTLKARETELLQKISKLESKIGDVTERQGESDNDRFLMGLAQQVSDWKQLNTDSGFLAWLAEVDPIYGLPRQAALTRAVENFDASQAANIFNAYKALVTPAANKPKPSQQLQSQVAPTRSRVSNTPAATDANTKIWREAEIGQFYDAARRGFIDNEEMVRIQKEIDLAISEGRVSL